ncbi:FAD-dependent oxidoreductase [uncultured Parasutterella sp.]|uniref:NAD(P)/FAD-dependent oxidoreductase n=1 Tax=uncultured Parasutterella sp. TaxID=1263098 RepID=UPI00259AE2B5|nr:FAD-dependent oxidoreductase [uncultured Parasutterella sp.]
MHIIVVGVGITGIACAHNLLRHGHTVTLIETASTPNQECSFGLAGYMGPEGVQMLCSPFKGKAGLASIFAKTRRLSWDVSIKQIKFLNALANARSADVWKNNRDSLLQLARYSVGLTEFISRVESLSFEQVYGTLRVYTNNQTWEEAHKEERPEKNGEWLSADEAKRIDPSLEDVPEPFPGAFYIPQELSGNASYFAKQIQTFNIAHKNLTMMYHTKVEALVTGENHTVTGVKTDKGEISADAVILSNNLGAPALFKPLFDLPVMTLTGWTITAKIDPMNVPPMHTVSFDNKDVLVTKLGQRLRVCGRYWLGDVTQEMTDKIIEELYESACKLLPMSAVWSDSTNWMGQCLVHPDSLPSCGETPYKGLYLNICHGLNGWSLAEGCAEMLSRIVEGAQPDIDPTPYSPMRFLKKN